MAPPGSPAAGLCIRCSGGKFRAGLPGGGARPPGPTFYALGAPGAGRDSGFQATAGRPTPGWTRERRREIEARGRTGHEETIGRIRELEAAARPLEPNATERHRLREPVLRYTEDFLDHIGELPAFRADRSAVRELRDHPIGGAPESPETLVDLVRRCVDEPGLNPASGGHLAYIPGGGIYASALGDYLAAVSDAYAGIRFTGPGAVEIENLCLAWIASVVGYPTDAAGNLASGGSIANLVAIVTAREAHVIPAKDFERTVVYLSEQTHHCVHKALRIAGMGECVLRRVPLDHRQRIRPDRLEAAVVADRAAGLRPWMVVASAGTTDVGAIDPLEPIAEVAEREGLWYHVDAAYGGFFALCPEIRPRLAGIERSDSLVIDPHKGLFLPYGVGAVLVKDRRAMHRAHRYRAAYMQDARGAAGRAAGGEEDGVVDSPAELSPELTKHFRGLRLWLPLELYGVEPFRACLEEKLWLTRYFHERVAELGFEVGPEPELSVTIYRWVPEDGDADDFNLGLVRDVHEDGRVFVSSTTIDGVVWLRLAVLSFRTHLETIELTLDVLREAVDRRRRDPPPSGSR